jgi:hypothetical protein
VPAGDARLALVLRLDHLGVRKDAAGGGMHPGAVAAAPLRPSPVVADTDDRCRILGGWPPRRAAPRR